MIKGEELSITRIVDIGQLQVGETLVNLGRILEIEEKDGFLFLVIDRLNERQVWKFATTDPLFILT